MDISLTADMDKILSKYFYQKNPGKENVTNHSINTSINILLYNLLAPQPKVSEIANTRVIQTRRFLIQHFFSKIEECFAKINLYMTLPDFVCLCQSINRKGRFVVNKTCQIHGYRQTENNNATFQKIRKNTIAIHAFLNRMTNVFHQLTTHRDLKKRLGTDIISPMSELQNKLTDITLNFNELITNKINIPMKSPQVNKYKVTAINARMIAGDKSQQFVFIPEVFEGIADKYHKIIGVMNQDMALESHLQENTLINLENNNAPNIKPRSLINNSSSESSPTKKATVSGKKRSLRKKKKKASSKKRKRA